MRYEHWEELDGLIERKLITARKHPTLPLFIYNYTAGAALGYAIQTRRRRGMTCPFCGSADLEIPTVDIGVGDQQCGPAWCYSCLASQTESGEWERRPEPSSTIP